MMREKGFVLGLSHAMDSGETTAKITAKIVLFGFYSV